jgi:hypothetical protein
MMGIHRSVTEARVVRAVERYHRTLECPGFCLACGLGIHGVEPDADGDVCERCGEARVVGAENALLEVV